MAKKILVIEDNAKTRNLFLQCLRAKGFHPVGVENGVLGIDRAKREAPDLILCDIKMPELDGYGVLKTLRQDVVTKVIPFIFVSAKASRNDIRKGMELGADDYLTKPCTVKELLAAIAAQLDKQSARRQWYEAESQPTESAMQLNSNTTNSIEQLTSHTILPQSIFPTCPQMSEVFRFIESSYYKPITLCDVAQAVGYSPAYLTNLMRRHTGKSVHRWIVERRMAQALSLLQETEQAVNQIAQAVGYQDACHFSRYFRQLYGTSPQAWRSARRR